MEIKAKMMAAQTQAIEEEKRRAASVIAAKQVQCRVQLPRQAPMHRMPHPILLSSWHMCNGSRAWCRVWDTVQAEIDLLRFELHQSNSRVGYQGEVISRVAGAYDLTKDRKRSMALMIQGAKIWAGAR